MTPCTEQCIAHTSGEVFRYVLRRLNGLTVKPYGVHRQTVADGKFAKGFWFDTQTEAETELRARAAEHGLELSTHHAH